jgi:hypothetical protein
MGGQVPRRPDQQQGGSGQGGQVAPGSVNVVRARQVIISGAGEGVFVYSGAPGLGNPPIFWAGSSPDPYGNVLPATAGVAGTGSFQAGNTIITATGTFTYSSTPAAGNLVTSDAPASTTADQFGNQVIGGGVASYGSGTASAQLAGAEAFYTGSLAGGWTLRGELIADTSGDLVSSFPGSLSLSGNLQAADVTASTINGSAATGAGDNGGVTSGPSGTVNAFPAAGPNHTHAEFHHHPI